MTRTPTFVGTLSGVLSLGGYGLWLLIGAALALDVHSDGRSEVLVPLLLGLLCIGVGIAHFLIRRRDDGRAWRGRISSGAGARERLLAMATFLPMLAVAGLARGDNNFWATRVAGAALALCCLGFVLLAHRLAGGAPRTTGPSGSLRALRDFLATLFIGGLWWWWCMTLQDQFSVHVVNRGSLFGPWQLALLLIGLSLLPRVYASPPQADHAAAVTGKAHGGSALILLACLLLTIAAITPWPAATALLAALSCNVGLALQRSDVPRVAAQSPSTPTR